MIKCGRPATQMPFYSRNVWEPPRTCFGMTKAEVGNMIPDPGGAMLPDRLINALVAFIFSEFVGSGPLNIEQCQRLLGEDAGRCAFYPPAAGN